MKQLETEHSRVTLHLEGNVLNDKELYLESKKIFGKLLCQNSMYKGILFVEYHLDAEYGYPVLIKSTLKESLVGTFSFEHRLEVKEVCTPLA
jgi:hypothetical protein